MSSPLVLGALQFVVLLHFLIVLACCKTSEPARAAVATAAYAHAKSFILLAIRRRRAEQEACKPERDAFLISFPGTGFFKNRSLKIKGLILIVTAIRWWDRRSCT